MTAFVWFVVLVIIFAQLGFLRALGLAVIVVATLWYFT